MKILVLALVVGCVILLAFRSCHSASRGGSGKSESKGGFFGAFHKAAEGESGRISLGKDPKHGHGAWDVWREHLRWESGRGMIRTDEGQYEVGRMSVHGLVQGIDSRVVRIAQPDGRSGFVVCDDSSSYLPQDQGQQATLSRSAVVGGTGAANPSAALFRTGAADAVSSSAGSDVQKMRVVGNKVLPIGGDSPSQGDVNSASWSNHVPYGPKPAPWSGVPGW